MFNKLFSTFLIIVMIFTTIQPAFADELNSTTQIPVPAVADDEVDVGEVISPLKKGQRAPFTGVLLSPKAVAKVTVELNSVLEKVAIEVDKAIGECEAACTFRVENLEAEFTANEDIFKAKLESQKKQNDVLAERIEELEKKSKRDKVLTKLGAIGGFVLGVATTVLIVFATSKAAN